MRRAYAVVAVVLLSVFVTRADVATSPAKAEKQFLAQLETHCYNGCPAIDPKWQRGDTVLIARGAYSLEVSTTTKVPFWSAEFVTAAEVQGPADRGGYRADPELRDEPHSTVKDYRSSTVKYDVGHQAPAANHKRSQKRMDETFYLSNMAPQIPSFNRGMWRTLEIASRQWITQRGQAWCITGPIFGDGKQPDREYKPKTIGDNKVAVPPFFYKIIVAPKSRGSKELESIAFIFPNREYKSPYDYGDEKYITSIREIERLTGINFMPRLSPAESKRLESAAVQKAW